MTRLVILTILLQILHSLSPAAIWKPASSALAADTEERPPLRAQIQSPQRLLKPDIPAQRLQTVPAAPKAEIDPPRRVVTQGQPATFDSKSIADPDTPITVYQWSGPDRQTSNNHRFIVNTAGLKPSTYTVTLMVRDRRQRQARDSATLIVEARTQQDVPGSTRPPVARINRAKVEVQQGASVRFSSASYHPDRNRKIIRSSWQTSWGQRASGDYIDVDTRALNPGEYRVRLEVADDQGLTAREEALLIVVAPPRDFDAAILELDVSPAPVTPNREVHIRVRVANRGKDALKNLPVRFEIAGARIGQITLPTIAPGETNEVTLKWFAESAGEQIVIATVNPDNQPPETNRANNVRRYSISVLDGLNVSIEPRTLEVNQGDAAKFSARIEMPGQPGRRALKYLWRGPGNRRGEDAEFSVDTSELKPGDHRIVLEISELGGIKPTAAATLRIRPPSAEVWLAADNQNPEIDGNVNFTSGTRPELSGVTYKFIFGDGGETDWSPRAEAVHRYDTPGNYTVRLLARRAGANLGETSVGINVNAIAYAVALRTESDAVRAGEPLAFIANVEPPDADVEYLFIFGDGRESGWTRSPTASHSYSRDGAYKATVAARIRGAQIIRGPVIRVNISASPWRPWLWLSAGFAAIAAAAAAYMRKSRLARIRSGLAVVPKLNLDDLRVETQGKLNSGCEISLRTVRGPSRSDIEASGPIIGGRNE
jgi:hypothetical protein